MKRFSFTLGAWALCALGFGLRAFRLTTASLTGDENWPWSLNHKPVFEWLRAIAIDDHPPLYYFILRPWTAVAGPSEFAYRIISVFAGLLTIAVLYRLGSRLFGRRAGLWAAALLTLSPQHVDFSQETRMYTVLTVLCLGAALCLWQALTLPSPQNRKAWAGYLLVMSGAIHTHYLGWLFWCAAAACIVLALRGRKLVAALAIHAAAALTFVPWTLYTNVTARTGAPAGPNLYPLDWAALARILNGTLNLAGINGSPTWTLFGTLTTLTLVGLGLWLAGRRREYRDSVRFAGLYVAVPVVLIIGLSYYSYAIWFRFYGAGDPRAYRFLIPLLPWGCALAGAGLALLRPRALAYAGLVVALALESLPTSQYLLAPMHGKSDYREMTRYVLTHQKPGDGIFLLGETQGALFPYYAPNTPFNLLAPDIQLLTLSPDQYRVEITRQAEKYQRLWVLVYGNLNTYDPANVVGNRLSEISYIAYRQWFRIGELRLYINQNESIVFTPKDALVNGQIQCEGVEVSSLTAHPGETVNLAIHWRSTTPIAENWIVFAHVLWPDGAWAAGTDGEPAAGSRPTTAWTVGETIIDRRAITLPPDLPPGTYTLQAGFTPYGRPDHRLPVTGPDAQTAGDAVWLGTLEVIP